jgi:ATP-dependent exoDNAse (exonuclease V) alpha subunit
MLTEIARENGYKVVGLAPVSKAVSAMREQGIDAQTIQRFVKRGAENEDSRKRLFLLDEASLAPTRALHSFMQQVRAEDHVILIGDPRQHTPVQAGFIFEQLMDAGVKLAQLNKNYRQQPQDLKLAVNLMAAGRFKPALDLLDKNGSIIEHSSSYDRYSAMAKDYALEPAGSVVTSPDNDSRKEINIVVRAEMRNQDLIGKDVYSAIALVARDVYDEDRKLAHTYRPGDRLRYHQANQKLGIAAKSYGTVQSVDAQSNRITVEFAGGEQQTYDPRRAYGVSIYETQDIPLAIGERVQFTAPFRQFANREMGTIESLDNDGNIRILLDDGRVAEWNLKKNPHIDYAYSMTSHALQGGTVNRQLMNVEAMNSHVDPLLDQAFTYVASSRPRHELRIYVDSKAEMAGRLDRVHEKFKALSDEQTHEYSRSLAIAI